MFAIALALNLEERLDSRTATISVIGRSDLSLPVARAFADRQYSVRVRDLESEGKGSSTTPESVDSEVTVICVPVPFTPQKEPDATHMVAAARWVTAHLRPGQLIVLLSPAYPGMTDQIVRPILESTGLQVGRELFLAVAPYRTIDGKNGGGTAEKKPVVVGGSDRFSTRLASRLMQQISSRVMSVSSFAAAEMQAE